MVSELFLSQLMLIALLWLCVMLHWVWPRDSTAATTASAPPRVAYLLAADIVSRLPSCRLSDDHQPVIMARNRFSTPRSSLFPSLYAHLSRSIPRSSTGILF